MTTYALGDIQGCLTPLKALLKKVDFSPSRDTLWAAGDVINRGPESLETLRFLYQLGDAFKMVLGNHDLHFLAVHHGTADVKNKDTLAGILNAPDRNQLANWLQQQPLLYRDKKLGYAMVHAGIPPQWTLKEAKGYAKEVAKVLRGSDYLHYFENMYGNTPDIWSDDLKGIKRLRLITNYLTRMRFCSSQGKLELETKTDVCNPPKGYAPWFSFEGHKCKSDKIIFGHWASILGQTGKENFIGLDTGCVWGGDLTLFDLKTTERISLDCGCGIEIA